MEYIVTIMFLLIGIAFGKRVLNQCGKNYDRNVLIGVILFFILGSKSAVFSTNDFTIMLSNIVPPFLLGILLRRYMSRGSKFDTR